MQKEGDLLKKAIKGSGKTQDQVAKELGMTRQNLALYFSKEVLPREFVEKVKDVLDIDILNFHLKTPPIDVTFNSEAVIQLKDGIINSQKETISALNRTIESLEFAIQQLQQQLQETTLQSQTGTGKRRSA